MAYFTFLGAFFECRRSLLTHVRVSCFKVLRSGTGSGSVSHPWLISLSSGISSSAGSAHLLSFEVRGSIGYGPYPGHLLAPGVLYRQVLGRLAYRVPVDQVPSPSLPHLCLPQYSALLGLDRDYLLVPYYLYTLRAYVSFAVRCLTLAFLSTTALTRWPRRCRP